jgi:hypothetical protein
MTTPPDKIVNGVSLWIHDKDYIMGTIEWRDTAALGHLAAELAREHVNLNPPPYKDLKDIFIQVRTEYHGAEHIAGTATRLGR